MLKQKLSTNLLPMRRGLLMAFWGGWAAVIVTSYYGRLWQLLKGDDSVRLTLIEDGLLSKTQIALWSMGLFGMIMLLTGPRILRWLSELRRSKQRNVVGLGLLAGIISLCLLRWLFPISISFPALREALRRAVLGVFGASSILLAAKVLGRELCRFLRWHFEHGSEKWLYHMTLGLVVLSYLMLGLAVIGFYRPRTVQILIGCVLLVGIMRLLGDLAHWAPQRLNLTDTIRHFATSIRPWDSVWGMIAVMGCTMALLGALAPEVEYDALWYHLWLPEQWLVAGGPVDPFWEYISLYPLGWELLFGMGLALGGAVAAKLLHFSCLLLTAWLVYQLTRRFLSDTSPWLAVALFITTPIVLWEATTAYIDLALALYVGLAVYALLSYSTSRRWQWLILAAINLGMALAIKHLALVVLALSTIGLAFWLWYKDRNLRQVLLPPLLLGCVSLLFPLPWYIRAWRASGNPVFPELYAIFGAFKSQDTYLTHAVPSYAVWRYINASLPHNARVLTFSGGDHFYSERERVWSEAPLALPATWQAARGQEAQVLETLDQLNVSHILFDKRQLSSLDSEELAIVSSRAMDTWYDRVYEDQRFVLYRLCWDRTEGDIPRLEGR